MRKIANPLTITNKFSRKLFSIRKAIYQRYFLTPSDKQKIVFITGCQRSGNTLLRRLFDKDLSSKTYEEQSSLSSRDLQGRRLNPYEEVQSVIQRTKTPLIVIKTPVESQNILKLLEHFHSSKTIWMFRDYKDVIQSNLTKFGMNNGIADIRPIVEANPKDWRSKNTSEHTRNTVAKFFSKDMNPYDAAALFWYARNLIFFEKELERNQRIFLCKYEDLVWNPAGTMEKIYEFIGNTFPGVRIISGVHKNSLGKGKEIRLSAEVEILCKDLYQRLKRLTIHKQDL